MTLLLAPITPHISHELWKQLGHDQAVIDAGWPAVDEPHWCRTPSPWWCRSMANCVGRSKCRPPPAAKKSSRRARNENVLRFIDGLAIRKVIVVPGKLVNIVAN